MSSHEQGIARIAQLARQAEARIRFARAFHAGARALCAALLVAVMVLASRKLGVLGESVTRVLLGACVVSVAATALAAWAWRLPEQAGARVLDRFHGLHDRLASALSFASRPAAEQTPFMRAAIDDAIAAAPSAQPRLAVPIALPRELGFAFAIGGVLALVGVLEVRTRRPLASARLIDPLEMSQDDLDDVKDFLKQIEQKDTSEDTKATIEAFNRLIADIADKRLDRDEAFRRIQELEEKLTTQSANDKEALQRDLEGMGEALKKAELTRPAGLALAHDDLPKARDAFRDLAQKLRNQAAPVDKAKLDQLREAVKEAAQQAEKNRSELERRREQLADDILKMKERTADGGSDEEESLLKKKEAELDRLDRELDAQRDAQRELDRLDRELEQSAEDLMKDLGLSAEDLEQGAEDLNRMEEQQMTQQEKEELKQKLDELRQLLRQQGQGGKQQIVRLQRFGRAAHGQQGGSGSGGQGQEQDQNGQGQAQNQGSGQQGNGGESNGRGQQGQGNGGSQGSGGETWIMGPNGEKLLMLSQGHGTSGQGSGQDGPKQGGQGQEGPGHWGTEHDPHVQGQATNTKMGTQDTQVEGADAQGGSRSQVILGAAQRGFSSRGYRKVYTEYHQVAEESLGKDDIPGGYRFYVKRYFQLIRPRDTP
jgi:hypothetical protein